MFEFDCSSPVVLPPHSASRSSGPGHRRSCPDHIGLLRKPTAHGSPGPEPLTASKHGPRPSCRSSPPSGRLAAMTHAPKVGFVSITTPRGLPGPRPQPSFRRSGAPNRYALLLSHVRSPALWPIDDRWPITRVPIPHSTACFLHGGLHTACPVTRRDCQGLCPYPPTHTPATAPAGCPSHSALSQDSGASPPCGLQA